MSDTHFGYQRVSAEEKTRRVGEVFDSVAPHYDLMNDLMSLGMHRLWKRCAAGNSTWLPGGRVLDLGAGTADMASLLHARVCADGGRLTVCDINDAMLQQARNRLLDEGKICGVDFVLGDAENLPFAEHAFDSIIMAFGLRNVTNKARALLSIYRALRYGGQLLIIDFSRVRFPGFASLYDAWSFLVVPGLGRSVAGDADSYRYLVESIRRHPHRQALSSMLRDAGFARVGCVGMSLGIVAMHKAYKL